MRSILLISLFVLTVSSFKIKNLADDPVHNADCPIDEDPTNPTHLPHADCSKFYKCLEGYAYVIDCPTGLWWNTVANYCDYPANTNCATGSQGSGNSGSQQPAAEEPIRTEDCPVDEDPTNPTHLPHADCSKFYKCLEGYAYVIDCPTGLWWNTVANYCDYPANTNCATGSQGSGNSGSQQPAAEEPIRTEDCPVDEDPTNPTHLPHADCSKFYKCLEGYAYVIDCPTGLWWNTVANYCDYPANTNCATGSQGSGNSGSQQPAAEEPIRTEDCPVDEDPTNPTHLPHADCSKFYKCLEGYAYVIDCPTGLWWNTVANYCDYPANTNCATGSQGSGNSGSQQPAAEEPIRTEDCPVDEDPTNPTHLPHADCSKFYKCLEGYAYVIDCPTGLWWNTVANYCDYPANTNCATGSQGSGNSGSQQPAAEEPIRTEECPIDEDPTNPTHLPHADCSKFYKCLEGYAYVIDCPAGLWWNIVANYCDYPANTNCATGSQGSENSGSQQPAAEEPIRTEECPIDEDPTNPTHLPHADCSKFYKCLEGYAYVIDCPAGLWWNSVANYCDYPQNVQCSAAQPEPQPEDGGNGGDNGSDREIERDNLMFPFICSTRQDPSIPIYLPHSTECNQFYLCDNGVPSIRQCQDNLVWNQRKRYCDFPQNVQCGAAQPEPQPEDGGNGGDNGSDREIERDNLMFPFICSTRQDPSIPIYLPHSTECNQFYLCDNGVPAIRQCQDNLVWNQRKRYCDFPQNVQCGATQPEPQPEDGGNGGDNESDREIERDNLMFPFICSTRQDPSIPIYLPHSTECNQFYLCDNGVPSIRQCQDNLVWNQRKRYCDFPQNVQCGAAQPEPQPEDGGNGGDNGSDREIERDNLMFPFICSTRQDPSIPIYLPHSTECNQFYLCDNGVPSIRQCQDNLVWNQRKRYCDFPQNVQCGAAQPEPQPEDGGNGGDNGSDREIERDNLMFPFICSTRQDPSIPIYLPHSTECNQFYLCDNGVPAIRQCQDNLVWNQRKRYCDFPQNVQCGATQPEPQPEDGGNGGDNGSDREIERDNLMFPFICSTRQDPSIPIYLPHSTECNQFYLCDNGVPAIRQCQDNLVWNQRKRYCDFPQNVQCGATQPEPQPEDGGNGGDNGSDREIERDNLMFPFICSTRQDPSIPIYLPHSTECNQFYLCDNGVPAIRQCQDNLVWNQRKRYCDFPQNVQCGATQPEPQPEDGGNGGDNGSDREIERDNLMFPFLCSTRQDPSIPIYLPHSTECNQFYVCDNGVPAIRQCEGNLVWNQRKRYCDFPQNVQCGAEQPEPQPEDGGNGGDNGSDREIERDNLMFPFICSTRQDPSIPIYLPHSTECNQFYVCDSGVPAIRQCQGNLVWNQRKRYCDFPQNVQCGATQPEPQPEDGGNGGDNGSDREIERDNLMFPFICSARQDPSTPIYLPHSTECNQFYVCDSGVPAIRQCQDNLVWNQRKRYCDFPQNVQCGATQPEPQPEDGGNGGDNGSDREIERDNLMFPFICSTRQDSSIPTYFPHSIECDQYYVCDNGVPAIRQCQDNLVWNQRKRYCDFPQNVQCGSQQPEDGGTGEDENGSDGNIVRDNLMFAFKCGTYQDPSTPIFFPHSTECNQFYICDNGVPDIRQCQDNLVWNQRKRYCDYPQNVQCAVSKL